MILACSCGQSMQIPEGSSGKTFRCPACAELFTVGVAEVVVTPLYFRCTKCTTVIVTETGCIGQRLQCPKCGRKCLVKTPDTQIYQRRLSQTQETIRRLEVWGQEADDPMAFDLVVVTGPKDACPVCSAIVEKIFSISGKRSDYPPLSTLKGGPPLHPGCVHNLAPYAEAFHKWEEERRKPGR